MSIADKVLKIHPSLLSHWGYWVILFGAMMEATPIFGLIIPGQSIVMAGGFLAKLGIFDLGDVMLISILGAILGDLTGYALGRGYGFNFITKYGKYVLFRKKQFDKTKKIMNHHTGKTLILGRFNPLTRAFAPFVAGSTDISFFKFGIYNVLGGVLWGASFSLLGYIFGRSYEIISVYVGKFVLTAVIISIIFVYLYRFVNKRKQIFSKYHIYSLILNIFSLYIFFKMVEDIISHESIINLDQWINLNITILHNPVLTKMMIYITNIISPLGVILLSLIFLGLLICKRRWYNSVLFTAGIIGGVLLDAAVKQIIHRLRPENALIDTAGYSFPSGHAMISLILFSLIIYSFKDDITNRLLRYIFITGNILLFFLIGFSRVYLNVHWFSDIIGGFSLGLFWITFLILIFKIIISFYGGRLGRIKGSLDRYMSR